MSGILVLFNYIVPACGGLIILIIVIRFIIFVVKNPEIVDKWSNLYYKYVGIFENNRKKKMVSSELDYRITKLAKEINNESKGIMPFGLRIKWSSETNPTVNVQDDKVILVLKEASNSDKNIVDAFLLFTPVALLPKARLSIDKKVIDIIDVYTIKKMLFSGKYSSAYNYFMNNVIQPRIQTGSIDEAHLKGIQLSDEKGFYTRVLLEEYKEIGEMLFGTIDEASYIQETIDFFNFIYSLATRKSGDDTTKLFFTGKLIRIGIIFVAKQSTINSRYGLDSYTHRVKLDFNNNANRVYIFGHALVEEESELDHEGFVVAVHQKTTFEYMDYIEKKLIEENIYNLRVTDKYQVEVGGKRKFTQLLTIERKAVPMDIA